MEAEDRPRCILEDTRQQAGKHDAKHRGFEQMGITLFRSKLAFGDYHNPPKVSVDTKKDIYELYQDVTADHERFKRECVAARDAGTLLIVLVENKHGVADVESLARWREPDRHFYMRRQKNARAVPMSGARIAKACSTMGARYGVVFRFCRPEEAAEKIDMFLRWGDTVGR